MIIFWRQAACLVAVNIDPAAGFCGGFRVVDRDLFSHNPMRDEYDRGGTLSRSDLSRLAMLHHQLIT
jgi:hypothetical protein